MSDIVSVEALALTCGMYSTRGSSGWGVGALALSVTPGGGANKWKQWSASRAVSQPT